MAIRTYRWKRQIRESKDRVWRDAPVDGCPAMVEVPDYRLGAYIKRPNSFRLGDRQEVPDELCGIHVGLETQMFEYDSRIVLESIDGEIVRLIREYPKADPNKSIALEKGVAYAKCKFEDCGKIIPPDKASQHLREAHGMRFQTAKDIDHTDKKYFDIGVLHGKSPHDVFGDEY